MRPKPANPFAPCLPHRYGVPRELGAVLIPPTPNENGAKLRVIIPRVHADRTVAQFRVQAAAVVGVGPRCRGLGWGQVGIGVLVLARFRSARARVRAHTLHTHDDAAQAPADSLLERFRSNTDLKHMMQFEATLTVESSKAKRLELTRCQPLQPLLGPLHQCTSRTRTRRVCCQCRHEDEGPEASVESLSSCGQPFQSGIQAPALSLPSALRGARAVRHRPLSNPNGTALMPPRSATSPNPGCADSPRRVPGLTT